MIGFGDRQRTLAEIAALFQERHPDLPPLNRSTESKIEAHFRTHGHVRTVHRNRSQRVDEERKLDILLTYQETLITPARQVGRDYNVSHKTVLKVLKSAGKHKTVLKVLKSAGKRPYKMKSVQQVLDDDFDRRVELCETVMNRIDGGAVFTLNGEGC
ncbi:hypothetical protein QE152_g21726 [Popillia japonica]|uniref:Transposase n=1 Tax=Popillia japonica TaxID=7064 RepID=A0AAW1KNF2_POPJA